MTVPEDLFTPASEEALRAAEVGYMQAAGLDTTAFEIGDPEQQILEANVALDVVNSALVAQMNRGYASLDTATDPGDFDPYNSGNIDATPEPGFLSNIGSGTYGTPRIEKTFATGTITIDNQSGAAINIAPDQVTFTRGTPDPDTGLSPTYKNAPDPDVYTNPNGTVTIANGATLDITIVAEEQGTASDAGAGDVSLTTVLGTGVTATNAASILAQDREGAEAYRARCRVAPATLSLNGPADAYRFIALSAYQNDDEDTVFMFPPWGDGTTGVGVDEDDNFTTFPNAVGTSLGINRVFVSDESATGTVVVRIAGPGGVPGTLVEFERLIDVLYWPECTTRDIDVVTTVPVNFVGTIKAKAGAGVTVAAIEAAADEALTEAFKEYPIGGFDQTLGAGTIYLDEYASTINGSHPAIYKVTLATPGADTALAIGEVALLGTTTWTVTIT